MASAGGAAPKRLVIVESPTKARTIARFLDDSYTVESSFGHIRDLPGRASDIPKAYRSESWARLGIDIENGFKPLYVLTGDRRKRAQALKKLAASADELYLATDEDREGEAIAWHLLEVLSPPEQVAVLRLVFHEITPDAIREALRNPRDIDRRLVDAQEARRLLDRLYGYEVSPVLWKKVAPRLSAGRVQSVATRIVVERERERMAFVPAGYWSLEMTAATRAASGGAVDSAPGGAPGVATDSAAGGAPGTATGGAESFVMAVSAIDGKRPAAGRDFGPDGALSSADVVTLDEATARRLGASLDGAAAEVRSVVAKPYRRRPLPPFITSTLQQEAGRRLRLSAQAVMRAAQSLYERGFITYMRTDSVTLSDVALRAARAEVERRFGKDYLPPAPRRYKSTVRNAQEAHEAIRPAGEKFASPESLRSKLEGVEARVYELIWRRTLACQMTDAVGETVTIEATAETESPFRLEPTNGSTGTSADSTDAAANGSADGTGGSSTVVLSASGTVISHEGFRRVWSPPAPQKKDDSAGAGDAPTGNGAGAGGSRAGAGAPDASSGNGSSGGRSPAASSSESERRLPAVATGDALDLSEPNAAGHRTQPPARFTEATLIRRLEGLGVGRPSTYASIITTITDRGYVRKKGTALVPTFTAFSVVALLEGHFGDFVDYTFTARMEHDLDEIARGGREYLPWLERFYFGAPDTPDEPGLKKLVSENLDAIDVRAVNEVAVGTHPDGRPIVARLGRFGPYILCGDARVSLPEEVSPDEVTVELALELLARPAAGRVLGTDPATNLPVSARSGRYGPYVQLGPSADDPEAKATKNASLLKSMTLDDVTLEDALRLLSLPRTVGVDPDDGEAVTTQLGRYGPYVKKGSNSRSLADEEQIFSIGLDECLALLAQPRTGRGGAPRPPLRELGADPVTGRELVLRDGRFGPYVTDGETNASLRAGNTPESITPQRASDLLAARRDAPPRPKSRSRSSGPRPGGSAKGGSRSGGSGPGGSAKGGSRSGGSAKGGSGSAGGTSRRKGSPPRDG